MLDSSFYSSIAFLRRAQATVMRQQAAAAAYTYPLDIQNGSAAFGLSLLRSAYAGSCLKVRRSSDNAEQDIGFSGTALDTASLLTFCSGTNGFIRTWYDQSGNGRDVSNGDAGTNTKLQIVTAGALTTTINAHAALVGADGRVLTGTTATQFIGNTTGVVVFVFHATTATQSSADPTLNQQIWGDTGGWIVSSVNNTPALDNMGYDTAIRKASVAIATGTSYVGVWEHASGAVNIYLNNHTASASVACGNTGMTTGTMRVGTGYSNGQGFDGKLAAILFYSASVSGANLHSIGAALAAYYGITWS